MIKILLIFLVWASISRAQSFPDGTLIFQSKKGLIGNIAKRMTKGDRYTHVAIVIDNQVWESDWPRAKRSPISNYGKRRSTNDYYIPINPLSSSSISAMRKKAQSLIGKPYRLRNYLRPNSPRTQGTWCSPFVGQILNAGGYSLSSQEYHEPQNLLHTIQPNYQFLKRVRK